MIVRRAESGDASAIAGVVRAVYDEHGFTWDAVGYHSDLRDAAAHYDAFWVAELDGEIVGTVGLVVGDESAGGLPGCDCSLERLYVLDRTRGRGVGSALVQTVVDEARARGCRRLAIWTDKRFENAHRLYLRFGARVAAERVHDDPDASHEWGLVLDLDDAG